ncbi:MAG TPA: DUF4965 domain-containing protein [Phycisphaerae bacterium]|nr:DUF4965 domain-containing protein [Phycisphaerae bacterium]HRY70744.1 DUF4965 domain-containing protein [Phycisphaerae bacterium]HSA28778.1 DUF4965 domain-containing protein [Phycisphaerae bacterium]
MSVGINRMTLSCVMTVLFLLAAPGPAADLRPPSVPLVSVDPYFSIWSPADRLTDAWPVHWTGKPHGMSSMVLVDGKPYRLMGPEPKDVPAMPQVGLQVLPTRTIYAFKNDQVSVTLTFMTPLLPDDFEVLARPLTYLTWQMRSVDGKEHEAAVYFDATAELVVNIPDQEVVWSKPTIAGLAVLRIGSQDQPILAKRGDDLRIDWGYLYAATQSEKGVSCAVLPAEQTRKTFAAGRALAAEEGFSMPRAVKDGWPALTFALNLGEVGDEPRAQTVMLAYDDIFGITYFKTKLRSYWRRHGAEAADLLTAAAKEFASLTKRCEAFDAELVADLAKAGGKEYADIGCLAYRQCFAANKIAADARGMPLLFPKENFSNGCVATVDVIYPMLPQLLLLSPVLAKASLVPVLDYSASPRWPFPFAPHDLGTYPIANGQVYGGGETGEENQMPVEESGNMLLLMGAIAKVEGKPDFAVRYWPLMTKWAEYLKSKGLDPENQLCTDDFAGHLAHNVNLSAKAILALGSYAMLCDMAGKKDEAAEYRRIAKEFATKWEEMARDGDHYRLAFDKPGTWSQKYNLVWDRLLGLDLFPESILRKEMAYYIKIRNKYGLPLDNRKAYTKLDWTIWTATLTGSSEDFEALVKPVHAFLQATPNRIPMTDWYQTTDAKRVGFQARSVVGGVFIKLLDDPGTWRKWAGKAATVKGDWAPLPAPPTFQAVVPTAEKEAAEWRYTTTKPADGWFRPDFDDSAWKKGNAGFGTKQTPGAVIGTEWNSKDIWLRRTVDVAEGQLTAPHLRVHHDEDAEIYVNGILAARLRGYTVSYEEIELTGPAAKVLKAGKNTLAVHCRQTGGGQYIDVGIVVPKK